MNAASAALFAAFLALWIVPVGWIMRKRSSSDQQPGASGRRTAAALALYSVLLLLAAWWWHVPLSTQKTLAQFAGASALATRPADCSLLQIASASAQRQSDGRLRIERNGAVRVDLTLWAALSASQRLGLQELARQLAACQGSSTPPPIQDLQSGRPVPVQ